MTHSLKICLLLLSLFLGSIAPLGAFSIEGTGDSEALFQALAAAYQNQYPDRVIDIPPSVGSSGGIRLLLQGRAGLARMARPLKEAEAAQNILWRQFAVVPLVFVANLPDSCLTDLTSESIIRIFRGELFRWNQLADCPSEKIYLARREAGDSSNRVLRARMPELARIERPAGRVLYTTPTTLQTIREHPYTLGYMPLSLLKGSELKVFSFNGVAPTLEAVKSAAYPLLLPLGIAWRADSDSEVRAFLDYLDSPAAGRIIEAYGALPVTSENRED